MRIFVKAKPGAKKDEVVKIDEAHFLVSTKEPPVQGRANFAITKLLADYFGVRADLIKLDRGFREKNKVFEIKVGAN